MSAADGRGATGEEQDLLGELLERDLEQPIPVPFLCECGERGCSASIMLTPVEYAELKSDPDLLFVVPDHLPDRAECVRDCSEYLVVRPEAAFAPRDAVQVPSSRREDEVDGTTAAPISIGAGVELQSRLVAIREVLEGEGQALARRHDPCLLDVLVGIDELKLSIALALNDLRHRR